MRGARLARVRPGVNVPQLGVWVTLPVSVYYFSKHATVKLWAYFEKLDYAHSSKLQTELGKCQNTFTTLCNVLQHIHGQDNYHIKLF